MSAVVVKPSASLLVRDEASVSLWFRPSDVQPTHYEALFYKAAEHADSASVHFSDRTIALFWIPGGIHAVYTFAGDSSQTVCSDDNFGLVNNVWHNLVFTFDSGAGHARVYLDGTARKDCAFASGTLLRSGNKEIGVGAPINTQAGDSGNFRGDIDSVRFYHGVLSDAEISEIYNNRK